MTSDMGQVSEWRKDSLDLLDRYFDNTQYDDLVDWESALEGEYVAIRKRKPRIIYNVAKVLTNKVASKLVGSSVFPKFIIEEDPDDTMFFRAVQKACNFQLRLLDPVKHALRTGSALVRYYFVNGMPMIEHYNSKYCYPEFDDVGELDSVEIKYVYADEEEKDQITGEYKKKWYRMVLTKTADILYDNPDYKPNSEPTFKEVERTTHGLGWVQGEWLCTDKDKHDPDGWSLYEDILGFIDDLNYSLSQSSQAIGYNQEPQLGMNGMDEDEIDNLIKSSQKAWNLGKEGKAEFIESDLKGISEAREDRDHKRQLMLDVVRVVLHDPEKMVAQAQSGEALKALNMPLVELVDELRAAFAPSFKNLLLKIGLTTLALNAAGNETAIQVPDGYKPSSLDIDVKWPLLYPPTINDINLMSQAANVLSTAQIISRESLTRWIAPYVGVENIDEELEKIESQEPLPSPFGDPMGGGPQ
jgi:hypothetical protein